MQFSQSFAQSPPLLRKVPRISLVVHLKRGKPFRLFPERYAMPMLILCHGRQEGRRIAWRAFPARDGRDSPLKYTVSHACQGTGQLGMAGIHRSSTLRMAEGKAHLLLGMAGIHRSSTLSRARSRRRQRLGMAGIHRSSTLVDSNTPLSWLLGMAGIHRSSTLVCPSTSYRSRLGMAGIHRSSTLRRTSPGDPQR